MVVVSTLVGIGVGGENGIFYQVYGWWFCKVFVIVVSEFKYLYFEVWVGCEGCLYVGGGPKMHNNRV